MYTISCSTERDIPALHSLWHTAFGDSPSYIDHFFQCYYRPERMIVLKEHDVLCTMATWFDTDFLLPNGKAIRTAYLYAVATHPDYQGRGYFRALLTWAEQFFRQQGVQAISTVPATLTLYSFYAQYGFRPCFSHCQFECTSATTSNTPEDILWKPLTPHRYGELREELLSGTAHIRYPEDALRYQAECSNLSGGGLYFADTPSGYAILCAEGADNETLILKEILASPSKQDTMYSSLAMSLNSAITTYRTPGFDLPFGMLKCLSEESRLWLDGISSAYLGLAFD